MKAFPFPRPTNPLLWRIQLAAQHIPRFIARRRLSFNFLKWTWKRKQQQLGDMFLNLSIKITNYKTTPSHLTEISGRALQPTKECKGGTFVSCCIRWMRPMNWDTATVTLEQSTTQSGNFEEKRHKSDLCAACLTRSDKQPNRFTYSSDSSLPYKSSSAVLFPRLVPALSLVRMMIFCLF